QTESKPVGIAKDVKVKVCVFHFLADFVVVDFKPDTRVLLILGRCFLKTIRALIDAHKGELTLRIGHKAITYNLDQTSRYSANYDQMMENKIDVTVEACEEYSQEVLGFFDVTASDSLTPSDDPIVSTSSPKLTPFRDNDFLLFEEADAFLGLEDDPGSPELDPSYYDPEGDILLLEAILNRNEYYCLIDGFSGYFQIPIDPRYQEKTTFTCPYGTFAYRRMPFGLCNAPGTFQRCLLAIFHDMVEKTMEVFMDDFSVFGNSFENYLSRLYKMLQSDFLLFEEADAFLGLEDDLDLPKINPFYYDLEGDILLLETILNSKPLPPLPNHEQYLPSFKKELKVCEAKTVKSSVDEPPKVELKDLPPHLEYTFLEGDNKLPIIIAKELGDEEKSALIKVLKSYKRAIAIVYLKKVVSLSLRMRKMS
nr:reverse transcriptase domain-containing protein [Tanacetum cinerariifolium]